MNELLVVTPNGYKTSKLYSVVPTDGTGDLTWVRNTTATRVNSSGLIESVGANVPRLDYSGGVTCPCILVEPQITNLLLYSEEFNNAYWLKSRVTISANSTVSPDGNTTADKIVNDTTATNTHSILRDVSGLSDSTNYHFSFFIKAAEYSHIVIETLSKNGAARTSQIIVGSFFTALNADHTPGSFSNYGNGWYRYGITLNTLTGATTPRFRIYLNNGSGLVYTGDGISGLYLWGAQLETASTVSSYIPTVASTQTRNADVATVTTPAGITSLIETYEDNTTNVVNPIPVTYQMSEGRIAKVVGL